MGFFWVFGFCNAVGVVEFVLYNLESNFASSRMHFSSLTYSVYNSYGLRLNLQVAVNLRI